MPEFRQYEPIPIFLSLSLDRSLVLGEVAIAIDDLLQGLLRVSYLLPLIQNRVGPSFGEP